jgi:hypothetical protein
MFIARHPPTGGRSVGARCHLAPKGASNKEWRLGAINIWRLAALGNLGSALKLTGVPCLKALLDTLASAHLDSDFFQNTYVQRSC